MTTQVHDYYWNFTAAYTDFNDHKFIGILQTVVSFIDRTASNLQQTYRYGELQNELQQTLELNEASIRKGINQLIKMGFVNTGLASYHQDAKPYINAHDDKQRKILLSRIVYSNASFQRTVTNNSSVREINFLIKTLGKNEKISKRELAALMRMRIGNNEYATAEDLSGAVNDPTLDDFIARKYNQRDHLWNLLCKLDGINKSPDGYIYLNNEVSEIADDVSAKSTGRDKYLQGIYKRQLKEEVQTIVGKLECMVNRLDYPAQMYIASHIKPYRLSTQSEAYDPNNGLLLSLNVDKFFDAGLISFEDNGRIIISKRLNSFSKKLHDHLGLKSLNPAFINKERQAYLKYHRENVFN